MYNKVKLKTISSDNIIRFENTNTSVVEKLYFVFSCLVMLLR